MKISILLPYKENFSPQYPGAVSIFLSAIINKSLLKNKIIVFGSTEYVERYKNIKYTNITIPKKIFRIESGSCEFKDVNGKIGVGTDMMIFGHACSLGRKNTTAKVSAICSTKCYFIRQDDLENSKFD